MKTIETPQEVSHATSENVSEAVVTAADTRINDGFDEIVDQLQDVEVVYATTIAEEDSGVLMQPEQERMTRRARIGAKLGRFAAKTVNGVTSLSDKFSNATAYATAHATIAAMNGIDKVANVASKGAEAYRKPLEKMADDKEQGYAKRFTRQIGRAAYRLSVVSAAVGGAYVAHTYASEAHAAVIDRIWVPGTGSAPDQNIINGNKLTLGYEGGAAPLVGETPYDTSVEGGVSNLLEALKANGDSVNTVGGYSQGADVVREAASKLSPVEQQQLVLNLSGDPSGEKGILTLAHDSPQSQLMQMLGFDTSPLKDTGGAIVNEVRVTNDIMADASYTIGDAEQFNAAVENGDIVGALRMLATTGEKAGGYFTTHAGAIDVLPQDRVTYDPAHPGNATVLTEQTTNGTLTTITPNVSAVEALTARHLGIRMTPEMVEAVEATVNPNVSNEQVINELADAAQEGIDNTPWLPPEVKAAVNIGIEQVGAAAAPVTNPAPANVAPAWTPEPAAPAYTAPVATTIAPEQVAPAYVAPAMPQPVEQFVQQNAAPIVSQVANEVQKAAPHLAPQVAQVTSLFGIK